MSEFCFICIALTGGDNYVTVIHIQAVYLTRLRLKADVSSHTAGVVCYPMVKVLGNRISNIVGSYGMTARKIISASADAARGRARNEALFEFDQQLLGGF